MGWLGHTFAYGDQIDARLLALGVYGPQCPLRVKRFTSAMCAPSPISTR